MPLEIRLVLVAILEKEQTNSKLVFKCKMSRKSSNLCTKDEVDSAYKSEMGTFSISQGVPVISNEMIVMGQVSYEVCYKGN